ncbi:hypothetical protein AB2F28_24155 (plasmid) [Escherichia coli]
MTLISAEIFRQNQSQ